MDLTPTCPPRSPFPPLFRLSSILVISSDELRLLLFERSLARAYTTLAVSVSSFISLPPPSATEHTMPTKTSVRRQKKQRQEKRSRLHVAPSVSSVHNHDTARKKKNQQFRKKKNALLQAEIPHVCGGCGKLHRNLFRAIGGRPHDELIYMNVTTCRPDSQPVGNTIIFATWEGALVRTWAPAS